MRNKENVTAGIAQQPTFELGLIISIGKYGGFWYDYRGPKSWRVALGFVAVTCVNTDGDKILEWARQWLELRKEAVELCPEKIGVVSIEMEFVKNELVKK